LAWELVVQALEKRYEAFIFSKYMYKSVFIHVSNQH